MKYVRGSSEATSAPRFLSRFNVTVIDHDGRQPIIRECDTLVAVQPLETHTPVLHVGDFVPAVAPGSPADPRTQLPGSDQTRKLSASSYQRWKRANVIKAKP